MKPPLSVRFLAGVMAAVLLAVDPLAAASEAGFWTERRRHSQREPRVAGLPAAPPEVIPGLLSLDRVTQVPALPKSAVEDLPGGFAAENSDLLSALACAFGSIRRISLPSGEVSRVVVHVQDVHQNLEAQGNIGRAVQSLVDKDQAGLVALEGAFRPIDLSGFRAFPRRDILRKVGDHLLRAGKISGPVHAALTGTKAFPALTGVDDPARYGANAEAYRRAAPLMNAARDELAARRAVLERRKAAVFNPGLLSLDREVEAYRQGRAGLAAHVKALAARAPRGTLPPAVEGFLDASARESVLDFKRVESERTALVALLVRKLDKSRIDLLVQWSAAYRLGKIRYADFYRSLRDLCEASGVPLSRFPAMDAYVRYVLKADRIDPERLLKDLAALEKSVYARLARSPEEKALSARSRALTLSVKLTSFSLTPDEWSEYRAVSPSIERERGEIDFSPFEDFYKEADARDRSMTDNLLKAMDAAGTRTAVLVTGGYHSPGMDERLRRAGAAVISFKPKIEKLEASEGTAYLSVFTQEKTPLQSLFQGRKLFLTPDPVDLSEAVPLSMAEIGMEAWDRAGDMAHARNAVAQALKGFEAVLGAEAPLRCVLRSIDPLPGGKLKVSLLFQDLSPDGGAEDAAFTVFYDPGRGIWRDESGSAVSLLDRAAALFRSWALRAGGEGKSRESGGTDASGVSARLSLDISVKFRGYGRSTLKVPSEEAAWERATRSETSRFTDINNGEFEQVLKNLLEDERFLKESVAGALGARPEEVDIPPHATVDVQLLNGGSGSRIFIVSIPSLPATFAVSVDQKAGSPEGGGEGRSYSLTEYETFKTMAEAGCANILQPYVTGRAGIVKDGSLQTFSAYSMEFIKGHVVHPYSDPGEFFEIAGSSNLGWSAMDARKISGILTEHYARLGGRTLNRFHMGRGDIMRRWGGDSLVLTAAPALRPLSGSHFIGSLLWENEIISTGSESVALRLAEAILAGVRDGFQRALGEEAGKKAHTDALTAYLREFGEDDPHFSSLIREVLASGSTPSSGPLLAKASTVERAGLWFTAPDRNRVSAFLYRLAPGLMTGWYAAVAEVGQTYAPRFVQEHHNRNIYERVLRYGAWAAIHGFSFYAAASVVQALGAGPEGVRLLAWAAGPAAVLPANVLVHGLINTLSSMLRSGMEAVAASACGLRPGLAALLLTLRPPLLVKEGPSNDVSIPQTRDMGGESPEYGKPEPPLSLPRTYASHPGRVSRGLDKLRLRHPGLPKILAGLPREAEVLFVGPGYGFEVLDILGLRPDLRVRSIGFEDLYSREELPKMIESRYWLSPRASGSARDMLRKGFLRHDINSDGILPYPSEAFDAVIVGSAVVGYLEDEWGFVREIHRLLKPGGVGVTDLAKLRVARQEPGPEPAQERTARFFNGHAGFKGQFAVGVFRDPSVSKAFLSLTLRKKPGEGVLAQPFVSVTRVPAETLSPRYQEWDDVYRLPDPARPAAFPAAAPADAPRISWLGDKGRLADVRGAVEWAAMGDVQSNAAHMVEALLKGGYVDERGDWSGGRKVLVFTGDLVDGGDHPWETLTFIHRLSHQAAAQGGAVLVVRGNHDQMMLNALNPGNSQGSDGWIDAWDHDGGLLTLGRLLGRPVARDELSKPESLLKELQDRHPGDLEAGEPGFREILEWMDAFPMAVRVNGSVLVVHAAPDFDVGDFPGMGSTPVGRSNMMWRRDWDREENAGPVLARLARLGISHVVRGHSAYPIPLPGHPDQGRVKETLPGVFSINVVPRRAEPWNIQALLKVRMDGEKAVNISAFYAHAGRARRLGLQDETFVDASASSDTDRRGRPVSVLNALAAFAVSAVAWWAADRAGVLFPAGEFVLAAATAYFAFLFAAASTLAVLGGLQTDEEWSPPLPLWNSSAFRGSSTHLMEYDPDMGAYWLNPLVYRVLLMRPGLALLLLTLSLVAPHELVHADPTLQVSGKTRAGRVFNEAVAYVVGQFLPLMVGGIAYAAMGRSLPGGGAATVLSAVALMAFLFFRPGRRTVPVQDDPDLGPGGLSLEIAMAVLVRTFGGVLPHQPPAGPDTAAGPVVVETGLVSVQASEGVEWERLVAVSMALENVIHDRMTEEGFDAFLSRGDGFDPRVLVRLDLGLGASTAVPEGKYLRVVLGADVLDEGLGVDEEAVYRLFLPFFSDATDAGPRWLMARAGTVFRAARWFRAPGRHRVLKELYRGFPDFMTGWYAAVTEPLETYQPYFVEDHDNRNLFQRIYRYIAWMALHGFSVYGTFLATGALVGFREQDALFALVVGASVLLPANTLAHGLINTFSVVLRAGMEVVRKWAQKTSRPRLARLLPTFLPPLLAEGLNPFKFKEDEARKKVDHFLREMGVGPGSRVVGVGSGDPIVLAAPWEFLSLERGAFVSVFEPDPVRNAHWARAALKNEGKLSVPKPEGSYFHKADIEESSADVVVMTAVLTDPTIDGDEKHGMIFKALAALKEGGYLVVGGYGWEPHSDHVIAGTAGSINCEVTVEGSVDAPQHEWEIYRLARKNVPPEETPQRDWTRGPDPAFSLRPYHGESGPPFPWTGYEREKAVSLLKDLDEALSLKGRGKDIRPEDVRPILEDLRLLPVADRDAVDVLLAARLAEATYTPQAFALADVFLEKSGPYGPLTWVLKLMEGLEKRPLSNRFFEETQDGSHISAELMVRFHKVLAGHLLRMGGKRGRSARLEKALFQWAVAAALRPGLYNRSRRDGLPYWFLMSEGLKELGQSKQVSRMRRGVKKADYRGLGLPDPFNPGPRAGFPEHDGNSLDLFDRLETAGWSAPALIRDILRTQTSAEQDFPEPILSKGKTTQKARLWFKAPGRHWIWGALYRRFPSFMTGWYAAVAELPDTYEPGFVEGHGNGSLFQRVYRTVAWAAVHGMSFWAASIVFHALRGPLGDPSLESLTLVLFVIPPVNVLAHGLINTLSVVLRAGMKSVWKWARGTSRPRLARILSAFLPPLLAKKDSRSKSKKKNGREQKGGFLHPAYVAYAQAVKKTVNPDDALSVGLYGGAGVDASVYLLSTNLPRSYFVSWNYDFTEEELRNGLRTQEEDPARIGVYRHAVYQMSGIEEKKRPVSAVGALREQLKGVGVDPARVAVDSEDGFPRIRFPWTYPGGAEREYSITFIVADITRPWEEPKLMRVLAGGIDGYLQRTGEGIPEAYLREGSFIRAVYAGMNPGGFFATDDISAPGDGLHDRSGDFPVPLPLVPLEDGGRAEETLHQWRREMFKKLMNIDGELTGHVRELGRLIFKYGWRLNIRRKPGGAAETETPGGGEKTPVSGPGEDRLAGVLSDVLPPVLMEDGRPAYSLREALNLVLRDERVDLEAAAKAFAAGASPAQAAEIRARGSAGMVLELSGLDARSDVIIAVSPEMAAAPDQLRRAEEAASRVLPRARLRFQSPDGRIPRGFNRPVEAVPGLFSGDELSLPAVDATIPPGAASVLLYVPPRYRASDPGALPAGSLLRREGAVSPLSLLLRVFERFKALTRLIDTQA